MTHTLIDEITETRGQGNRECIGQGLANITCGLFGGMGGCAMIGQSLINVNSGGRGRLSGVVATVCLLMFVLLLAPWIEMIPMAALVGVMFMVAIGTFECVKFNDFGSKIYQLHGPLFFASTAAFKELFDPKNDPDEVVLDFYYPRVYDHFGLEAANLLAEKYDQYGKRLHLTHMNAECRKLLHRASSLVEVNLSEDPQYHVATERIGRLLPGRDLDLVDAGTSCTTAS